MRACVSAPAPTMRAARASTGSEGEDGEEAMSRGPLVRARPAPERGGTRRGRRERHARIPGSRFFTERVNTPRLPHIGKGPTWRYQEALAALRPRSLPPSEMAVPATYDATARGFGQATAQFDWTCCHMETCPNGLSFCAVTETVTHRPGLTQVPPTPTPFLARFMHVKHGKWPKITLLKACVHVVGA